MARRRLPFTLRSATAADEEALDLLERDTLRPDGDRTWDGVRILERKGKLIGAFRVLPGSDRLVVAWILVRPEHPSRGIGTRIVRLIQAHADRSRLPVELHVPRVNDRARGLYLRLGFTVVDTNDTHHVMRWEGRRTIRHERQARRRASRSPVRREMTLGPHEWLLLGGSVLAGQQMVPMGVGVALGFSAFVAVALALLALKKRLGNGVLLLRVGWLTRTTALILGVAFVVATVALVESGHAGAPRVAPRSPSAWRSSSSPTPPGRWRFAAGACCSRSGAAGWPRETCAASGGRARAATS